MKIPKPKRGKPSDDQIQAIISLLKVWPEVPDTVVEQFIQSKFKVTLTSACLQEAKRLLEMHEPEYTEKSVLKKAFCQQIIADLTSIYGVSGITEKEYFSRANKALDTKFGERTNGVLVKSWVKDVLSSFAATPIGQYVALRDQYRKAYKDLDTMEKQSRQEALL